MGTILSFALVGTTLSAFFVGGMIYLIGLGGLSIFEALAFGALISAVDPVGTLAIFGAIKVDPKLDILVFGESILNDAISIVLYDVFMQLHEVGFSTEEVGK